MHTLIVVVNIATIFAALIHGYQFHSAITSNRYMRDAEAASKAGRRILPSYLICAPLQLIFFIVHGFPVEALVAIPHMAIVIIFLRVRTQIEAMPISAHPRKHAFEGKTEIALAIGMVTSLVNLISVIGPLMRSLY